MGMTVEVIYGRNIRLFINGKHPDRPFRVGGEENDLTFGGADGGPIVDDGPLTIGEFKVIGLKNNGDPESAVEPTQLTLVTADGKETVLPVTFTANDAGTGCRVTLLNGDVVTLDETQLFVRAETC